MESKLSAWLSRLAPTQRLAVGGGAAAALTGVVWYKWGLAAVGWATLVLVLFGLAIYGVNQLLRVRNERRAAGFKRGLIEDIRKAKAEIGAKFEDAIEKLKANGVDVYRLPWFFFLGEPQSGKTYTIKRSEMRFPIGREGVSGEGGTRDCDFWFTNNAVIVDTAGRLTVQEDKVVDAEQWNEVLRRLRRWRPNCPINGVLLGIPCTSLIGQDTASRNRTATVLGTRLKELQGALGIRFPVFIIVLKTDLVYGFDAFFKRLPVQEDRHKQLLGWSNPAPFDQPFDPGSFGDAFDSVVAQLRRWRMKFMADEQSLEKVDGLYVLPDELGNLKQALWDYVRQIFERGEYGQPGFLRGIYFTSSLQQGQAIPIAIEALRDAVGAPPPAPRDKDAEKVSTPFFIRDLYEEKVIPEKGLVLRTDRSRFGNSIVRISSLWGGVAAVVIALVMITVQWFATHNVLEQPGQLVAKAVGTDLQTRDQDLDLSAKLGQKIEEWQAQNSGWFSGFLYPSPEHDEDLIEDLKFAYTRGFEVRLLGPWLCELAQELGRKPPTNWGEYLDQRDRLRCLLGLRYERSSGEAFAPDGKNATHATAADARRLERLLTSGDHDKRLFSEFERYLELGGNPRMVGHDGDNLKKVIANINAYLEPVLSSPAELANPPTVDDKDEPLYVWRKVLGSANELKNAYAKLLEVDRSSSSDCVASWNEKYGTVKAALEHVTDSLSVPLEDDVETRVQELKREIHTNYWAELLSTDWGRNDNSLTAGEQQAKNSLDAMVKRIRAGLDGCSHVAEAPTQGGKRFISRRPEIDNLRKTLQNIDTLLLKPPDDGSVGVLSEEPRVEARLKAASWLNDLSSMQQPGWRKDQLVTVLLWFHGKGYDAYWRTVIGRYGEKGSSAVDAAVCLDSRRPADAILRNEQAAGTEYDPPAYKRLVEHVSKLTVCADTEKKCLERPHGGPPGASGLADYPQAIVEIKQGYIKRYLNFFKDSVARLPLFVADRSANWQLYCKNKDKWSGQKFVSSYLELITEAKKVVEAVKTDCNDLKSMHSWAAALDHYDEAKLSELRNSLQVFANLFTAFKGEPDTDLMSVRSDRQSSTTKWETSFAAVREWFRSGPLQDDIFSKRLLAAEADCRRTLCEETKSKFDEACTAFEKARSEQLSGRFPFLQGERFPFLPEGKEELRPDELQRLYAEKVDQRGTMRSLLKYTVCFKKQSESENSPGLLAEGAKWNFVSATADLMGLLFDEKGNYKKVEFAVWRPKTGQPNLPPAGLKQYVTVQYREARISLAGAPFPMPVTGNDKIDPTWQVSTDGADSGDTAYEILVDEKSRVVQLVDEKTKTAFPLELRVSGYWSPLRLLLLHAKYDLDKEDAWVVNYDVGKDTLVNEQKIRYQIWFKVQIKNTSFSRFPNWSDLAPGK